MSPSFGAERGFARGQTVEKRLKTMVIEMPQAEGGDHIVHHDHQPPHDRQSFKFAPAEHEALAAHLSKHLGLKLPGKAAGGESAEPEVSKSNFEQ